MRTKNTVPPSLKIAGWLISLFAFAIGFWHTHLGLRSFEVLSSNYGSLVFSLLILLVLLVSYNRALNGKTSGFIFYLICATFYFIFNLTSFYPTKLGRKLVKEEAIILNDTMQNFVSKVNREFGKEEVNTKYNSLTRLRDLLIQEVEKQSGFGVRATDYLRQINEIIKPPYIKPNLIIGSTVEERKAIAEDYKILINKSIESFVEENLGVGKVDIINRVNEIKSMYEPELTKIIEDNTKINIDSIKTNPQIKTMQQVATKMDNICIDANKIASQNNRRDYICTNYGEVKSQTLGTFEHTIWSVWNRLNKIDTWGILILCFFIDFIVPLAIYFLIRKRDDDDEADFFKLLFSKNKNFNKN